MSINYSELLKQNLKEKAIQLGRKGRSHKSAFIFDDISDNFHPKSYENIVSNNNPWDIRLDKKHSYFKGDVLEMQSSNSSDALLMSVFCHPNISTWKGVSDLLNIDFNNPIEFGWKKAGFSNETRYPTEVDMKIGNHLFEAKLTEKNFTEKELSIVLNYDYIEEVFDIGSLINNKDMVCNYQLIRNILAAYINDCKFTVILDQRRIDLIRHIMVTIATVKKTKLRKNIGFVTWQEIASVSGPNLHEYLNKKYFK